VQPDVARAKSHRHLSPQCQCALPPVSNICTYIPALLHLYTYMSLSGLRKRSRNWVRKYFTCYQNPHVVFSVTGRDLGASDIPVSVPAKTSHLEARRFSFTPAAAFLWLDIPLALLDAINVMDQQLLSRANHTSLSPLTLRSMEQQELANQPITRLLV
jgi:hypothetical protein